MYLDGDGYRIRDRSRYSSLCISVLNCYNKHYYYFWQWICKRELKVKMKSLNCVWTSCDPINCSLPGSSVHGIFQARILEWVAISSPGHCPNPGIELRSPTFQANSLQSELPFLLNYFLVLTLGKILMQLCSWSLLSASLFCKIFHFLFPHCGAHAIFLSKCPAKKSIINLYSLKYILFLRAYIYFPWIYICYSTKIKVIRSDIKITLLEFLIFISKRRVL